MNRSFFARHPVLSTVIVLVTALAGGVVAFLLSNGQTPRYSSTARYVVGPGPALLTGDARDLVLGLDALNGPTIVPTYAEFMASQTIIYEAARDIGLETPSLVDYEFIPVEVPGASLIDLTVTGPDPTVSAALANAVGDRAGRLAGTLFSAYEVAPLDIAVAANHPSSPQPARDALLAAVLAGGLAVFVLLQTLIVRHAPVQPSTVAAGIAPEPALSTPRGSAVHTSRDADEHAFDVDHRGTASGESAEPEPAPGAANIGDGFAWFHAHGHDEDGDSTSMDEPAGR